MTPKEPQTSFDHLSIIKDPRIEQTPSVDRYFSLPHQNRTGGREHGDIKPSDAEPLEAREELQTRNQDQKAQSGMGRELFTESSQHLSCVRPILLLSY